MILASVDIWTTATADKDFLLLWRALKQCCTWLYVVCKSYDPQVCKAAMIACRANLIFTPRDPPNTHVHELLPYCKLDHDPEQKTPVPDKLHEQSDFLRTCRMVRLDDYGLPSPSLLRWMLKNLACFRNLQTLQLSRPQGRLDALLPVVNEWLGAVAANKSGMPPKIYRLSLCRWPGIDFKAVAAILDLESMRSLCGEPRLDRVRPDGRRAA